MRAKQWCAVCLTLGIALLSVQCGTSSAQQGGPAGDPVINIPEDRPSLEFVGQFINSGANSQQFGYVARVQGISDIFNNPSTQDETTAMLTFFTQATTNRVFANGPFRIIQRTGTTTLYFNPGAGASFATPSSFQAGTPIQVSDYQQQVVFDTISGVFTTVHLNTVTSVTPFTLGGVQYQLGHVGQAFRTQYTGHANAPGQTPGGWFGGHAVGVTRAND